MAFQSYESTERGKVYLPVWEYCGCVCVCLLGFAKFSPAMVLNGLFFKRYGQRQSILQLFATKNVGKCWSNSQKQCDFINCIREVTVQYSYIKAVDN